MTEPIQPSPDDATLPGQVDLTRAGAGDDATLPPSVRHPQQPSAEPELKARERVYQLAGEVARGGMGAVLRAKDLNIERTVALKVVLAERADDQELVQRFAQEAKLTGQLEHPNIVPIYDLSFDEQGHSFYTMKFVKGVTLHEILSKLKEGDDPRSGTASRAETAPSATDHAVDASASASAPSYYSLAQLLTIFQKVCDAVAFAHSKGVIHRDLKPANIMVGEYGEVLVMDWGLAKRIGGEKSEVRGQRSEVGGHQAEVRGPQSEVSPAAARSGGSGLRTSELGLRTSDFGLQSAAPAPQLTLAGTVMGSPQYMAPEQADGKLEKLDARTDIFALGGMLYHLLTLHPPVSGDSLDEMLEKIRTGAILPPTSFNTKSGSQKAGTIKVGTKTFPQPPLIPLRHCPGGRIPESLGAVAMKALSLKREHRYQTVRELQQDIEAYQGGFATGAEHAGTLKLLWLLIRRHRKEFGLAAAALVVLVATVTGFMVRVVHEKNRAEAEKQHAQTERDRAERALTDLKGTAPTFYRQSQGFIKEHELAKALEMISYAITLRPDEAEYRVLQGNIFQTLLRLGDAREAYRQALERKPEHALAAENLTLCEKILQENPGQAEVKLDSLNELQAAMRRQGRFDEAVAILQPLDANRQRLVDAWNEVLGKAGWKSGMCALGIDPKGVLDLQLFYRPAGDNITDLAPLKGMPLTRLDLGWGIGMSKVADLTPLKGMPLRELYLVGNLINNLEPLRGLPLEFLHINATTVTDLSPLMGLRLKWLYLSSTDLHDLSPLKGMPLEALDLNVWKASDFSALRGMPLTNLIINSITLTDLRVLEGMPLQTLNLGSVWNVEDLRPLRGMRLQELQLGASITDLNPLKSMPLKRLSLFMCHQLNDLTPLENCKDLEILVIPTGVNNIEFLRRLPKLKQLGYEFPGRIFDNVQPVAEFWKAYDAKPASAATKKALP